LKIVFLGKCWNLSELQGREKYKNWWKPEELLALFRPSPPLQSRYLKINNISMSYLWNNYMSPPFLLLKKKEKKSSTK
jgi:hypothetical protein